MQFIKTLMAAEQESSESVNELFYTLSVMLKLKHYETMLSLKCCKLMRHPQESV